MVIFVKDEHLANSLQLSEMAYYLGNTGVAWLQLGRQNHHRPDWNWTTRRDIEQRSPRGMTLAMWNMAQKWKPRLQSRRFAIVGSSVLRECRPRCRSIRPPTMGWPIYGRHSTAAVYKPVVDRCLVVTSPTYHRRSTDTPPTHHRLIIDCCLTLSRHLDRLLQVLISVKSQRDAHISWKLLASLSRLFPVSTLTWARVRFCHKVCC